MSNWIIFGKHKIRSKFWVIYTGILILAKVLTPLFYGDFVLYVIVLLVNIPKYCELTVKYI